MAGMARTGEVSYVEVGSVVVSQGRAWQARLGAVRLGMVRCGLVWRVMAGMVRFVVDRLGSLS
jgi:hypothetical protein